MKRLFGFLAVFLLSVSTVFAASKLLSNPSSLDFSGTMVSPSPAQTYTLGWNQNTGAATFIVVKPSLNVQVSRDGSTFKSYPDTMGVMVSHSTGGTTNLTTIYVRVVLASPGTVTDSVTNADTAASPQKATVLVVGSVPLPIQIASFKAATLAGNGVTLTWTTASETNNYGFYVQRNGVDLTFIAGHGTSLDQHTYSYTENPSPGQYRYGLKQVDLNGTAALSETILMDVVASAPAKFALNQNYPNPFNPSSKIAFSITKEGPVTLRIYDILGREVSTLVNENRKPGQYTEHFDGGKVSSGVYMYVLRSAEGQLTGRMILSK